MKKTYISAVLLALSIPMLFTTVTLVHASVLLVTPGGNVWQFKPLGYSGKDITNIEAYYYTTANPDTKVTIEPLKVIYTDNLVTLVFDPSTLPTEKVETTGVHVTGPGIDDIATGPGFAFGGHV